MVTHLRQCLTSKFVKKYSATCRIFKSLLDVWESDQKQSSVFDILLRDFSAIKRYQSCKPQIVSSS